MSCLYALGIFAFVKSWLVHIRPLVLSGLGLRGDLQNKRTVERSCHIGCRAGSAVYTRFGKVVEEAVSMLQWRSEIRGM